MASSEAHEPAPAASSSRRAARLAWSIVGLAFALALAGTLASLVWGELDVGHDVLYDIAWGVIAVSWAIVGALVA
jgi:hypothetical protein